MGGLVFWIKRYINFLFSSAGANGRQQKFPKLLLSDVVAAASQEPEQTIP
jgi:hypothetical protein